MALARRRSGKPSHQCAVPPCTEYADIRHGLCDGHWTWVPARAKRVVDLAYENAVRAVGLHPVHVTGRAFVAAVDAAVAWCTMAAIPYRGDHTRARRWGVCSCGLLNQEHPRSVLEPSYHVLCGGRFAFLL